MEDKKFIVGQYVYSNKLSLAVEILPYYDQTILFSCSVDAANRFNQVYTRLASGNEVFQMLDMRNRVEKRLIEMINRLKDLP